jgi:hypothetical protein
MLTEKGLTWACTRLGEFYAVQSHGDLQSLIKAVTTLREAYGFTDELLAQFATWIEEFSDGRYAAEEVALGFLLGIMATDYEQW